MKFPKNGNLAKLVAFFLISAVLMATIALSASGWNEFDDGPDSGNFEDGKKPSIDNSDENKDGQSEGDDIPVVAPKPVYTHYITGLEINEEDTLIRPMCVVIDPSAPIYGVSSSFMTVEIPVEDGKTRFMIFTNDATSLGKLGSIAPTRKYISNIAGYLGGVTVSIGCDDSFDYAGISQSSPSIDFTSITGYHYTEYGEYCYTNADLLRAYVKNNGISTVMTSVPTAPYNFATESLPADLSDSVARTVLISHSQANTTEFTYSEADGRYYMSKNGNAVSDLLNDKQLAYDNLFVLLADSVTYETSTATQSVIDTMSGGKGYYISDGKLSEITWAKDSSGSLVFLNSDGERLTVNPGHSYVGFTKSSQAGDLKFN